MGLRPHSIGLHDTRELYSEASAADVQVVRSHLQLGTELESVVHVVLVLKTKTLQDERGHGFFLCSFRELRRSGNVRQVQRSFKESPRSHCMRLS